MKKQEKFVKPAQFAEQKIIKNIVSNKWVVGQSLLPERELADFLGITRPTLREVLQRLSRDGWITIKHGRPTMINDYIENGGLGILRSLVSNSEISSNILVRDWLEFRVLLLPDLAFKAIQYNKEDVLKILDHMPKLDVTAEEFSSFDWFLQFSLVKFSKNTIAKMLFNDIAEIYNKESKFYFKKKRNKELSLAYYNKLKRSILGDRTKIRKYVKQVMLITLKLWEKDNNI